MSVVHKEWLESRFTVPVEVETGGVEDSYGEVSEGVTYTTFCRVEPMTELVTNAQGAAVIARHKIWIDAAAVMAPGAVVRLLGETYEAIKGGPFYDMDGEVTHQEWIVGDA